MIEAKFQFVTHYEDGNQTTEVVTLRMPKTFSEMRDVVREEVDSNMSYDNTIVDIDVTPMFETKYLPK